MQAEREPPVHLPGDGGDGPGPGVSGGLAFLQRSTKKSADHCPASGDGMKESAELQWASCLAAEESLVPSDSPGVLIQTNASRLLRPRSATSVEGLLPRPEPLILHQLAQSYLSLVTPFLEVSVM